ncbi:MULTISPECIES: DUF1735 and LamG domain-containing protein [Bacteroides]|uniref:DUF1735 and LamG domain-containing protein n=1 Tax=Bacteroides TaxID=816 RepID=UPI0005A84A89|nr:DUF1735 and LamG domain-containing protein [Bacteroides neonati]MCP3893995.1 DUF1735 domain-containing protein [Bacteroides sp.]
MKRINLYLISMALLSAMITSCKNEESFDNNVFVNAAVKTNNILLKSTIETSQRSFQIALAQRENQEVIVHFEVNPDQVATYNEAYYSNAELLPEGFYELSNKEVQITAGSVRSTDITVRFLNLNTLNREKIYVLPVSIASANVGILQSGRTIYYVLKGAALINTVADIEKNNLYVDWKKPEVVTNMRKLTAEALIRARNFDRGLNTIMGIEGKFLIRAGDSGIPSNQLQVATSAGNFTSSELQLPTNEWVHIAVTYDADAKQVAVYINGKNAASGTLDAGAVNWGIPHSDESDGKPRCFWIGYSYNNDRYLAGDISEVRIWNKVLTTEEINAKNHFYEVEPKAEGLVTYWKFDEGAGMIIKDYTVNENHATASNPLKWTAVELPSSK